MSGVGKVIKYVGSRPSHSGGASDDLVVGNTIDPSGLAFDAGATASISLSLTVTSDATTETFTLANFQANGSPSLRTAPPIRQRYS